MNCKINENRGDYLHCYKLYHASISWGYGVGYTALCTYMVWKDNGMQAMVCKGPPLHKIWF